MMTDKEYKEMEKKYLAEKYRREVLFKIENSISEVDNFINEKLKSDGYSSVSDFAISAKRHTSYDGASGDVTIEQLKIDNVEDLKLILNYYKQLLIKKYTKAKGE